MSYFVVVFFFIATTSPPPYLRWLNSTDLHTKQLPRGVQYPIDCRLTDPSKSVTLLKRGVPVQVDGTKVKKDNQIFTLYDVKEDDNGIYGCRAERVKDLTRVRLYVERSKELLYFLYNFFFTNLYECICV